MKILWKQRGWREPNDRQYDIHPDWEDGETDDWEEDVSWISILGRRICCTLGCCTLERYRVLGGPEWDERFLRFKLRLQTIGQLKKLNSNICITYCDTKA